MGKSPNAAGFESYRHAAVTCVTTLYLGYCSQSEDSKTLLLHYAQMSSKRKWDQAAPDLHAENDLPFKATKTDEVKTASEAAAAAAAIAAKIAAQFSAGGSVPGSIQIGQRDPHDAEFTHDIDINDVRNRYVLTKGSTQSEVCSHPFLSLFLVSFSVWVVLSWIGGLNDGWDRYTRTRVRR